MIVTYLVHQPPLRTLNLSGVSAHIGVYTSSESVCREVMDIIDIASVSDVMSLAARHGGCEVISEKTTRTCDGEIEVTISPANLLAKIGWRITSAICLVSMARLV